MGNLCFCNKFIFLLLDGNLERKGSSENRNTISNNYKWRKVLEDSKAKNRVRAVVRAACESAVGLHRKLEKLQHKGELLVVTNASDWTIMHRIIKLQQQWLPAMWRLILFFRLQARRQLTPDKRQGNTWLIGQLNSIDIHINSTDILKLYCTE